MRYVSLSDLLHSVCQSLGPSMRLQMALFSYFLKFSSLLAALGPPCCVPASSSCSKWGLLSSCDVLLVAMAFHVANDRLQCAWASVAAAHGLSYAAACGLLLDQGSNPCIGRCISNRSPPGKSSFIPFYASVIFHCVSVPHLYPLMDIQVISMPWLSQWGCVFYLLSVCNPISSWWLKSEFWPIGFYFLYTKCIRSFSAEWASPPSASI